MTRSDLDFSSSLVNKTLIILRVFIFQENLAPGASGTYRSPTDVVCGSARGWSLARRSASHVP